MRLTSASPTSAVSPPSTTLNAANLSTEDLADCIAFYRQVQGRPREIATAGLRLLTLERTHGLPYDAILTTYEERAARTAELDAQIRALVEEQTTRARALPHLADLEAVHRTLVAFGLTTTQFDQFIQDARAARTAGFTPQLARQLGEEFTRAGYDPRIAAERVVTLLTQHVTLNAAVAEKRTSLDALTRQETAAQSRVQALNTESSTLQNLIEQQEEAYRVRTTQLEAMYQARATTLQVQHAQAQAEATQQLHDQVATLTIGRDQLTQECTELTEQAAARSKEIAFAHALVTALRNPEKLSPDECTRFLDSLESAIKPSDPFLKMYTDYHADQIREMLVALFPDHVVPIDQYRELAEKAETWQQASQQVPSLQRQLDADVAEQARNLFQHVERRRCRHCGALYTFRYGDPDGTYGRNASINCPLCPSVLDQENLD